VIDTSQTQSQTEQLEPAAPSKKSSRKSILALSVFALGLNAAAAAYTTSPSDFAFPNFSGLVAELLPHEGASKPIPDAVVAALNDIQSDQQHIATALQDNGSSLQRNTTLLQDNGASLQRNTALLKDNGSLLQQNSALLQQDATKLDRLDSENSAIPRAPFSWREGRPSTEKRV
jgi:Skp family chaperone for outer membrane proteins